MFIVPQRDNVRYISDSKALQIALGNINVNTGERLADYDPDTAVKVNSLIHMHCPLLVLC